MNLRDFQQLNAQRGTRWHSGDLMQWSLLEWAGAMAGEAGEACNVAKKLRRLDMALPNREGTTRSVDVDLLRTKLASEVADTIIYGLLLLSNLDVDAEEIISAVFNKKSQEYGFPERVTFVPPASPAEPNDDLVAVLTRAIEDAGHRHIEPEDLQQVDSDIALLSSLASLVKAWREAEEEWQAVKADRDLAARRRDEPAINGHFYHTYRVRSVATSDLLSFCLRGAPTLPNDDKGGAGPRMGESKEVGNPQGSVVHLASPSSPNDDKGGTK